MSSWIAFSLLTLTGVAHSVAGEILMLRPLARDAHWTADVSRPPKQRILRFAWHLTTIAWLGLATILVGASVGVTVGIVCLASGVFGFVTLRSHIAWPLFIAAGAYSLDVADAMPHAVLLGLIGLAIGVAGAGALLHLAWVVGASWGKDHAIPEDTVTFAPVATPGRIMTLGAAGASGTLAGLLWWVTWGTAPAWVWWLVVAAALVLVLRVAGDGNHVGFTKKARATRFAELDDALYTPLFVTLAFGAIATLHAAGSPF